MTKLLREVQPKVDRGLVSDFAGFSGDFTPQSVIDRVRVSPDDEGMSDFRLEELSLEHEAVFLNARLPDPAASLIVAKKLSDPGQFRKFVKDSAKQRLDWRPGANKTSITRYLMLDQSGQICALGVMRFPLDEKSDFECGNLRCEVPLDLRGRGHGSMCLALLLFEAVRAGLRRVLVTCHAGDAAARRVIEKNRGEFDGYATLPGQELPKYARYWISFL